MGTELKSRSSLRAAKRLEVTGDAGEQFDNCREVGHLSAAQSCAALVTEPWAVHPQPWPRSGSLGGADAQSSDMHRHP